MSLFSEPPGPSVPRPLRIAWQTLAVLSILEGGLLALLWISMFDRSGGTELLLAIVALGLMVPAAVLAAACVATAIVAMSLDCPRVGWIMLACLLCQVPLIAAVIAFDVTRLL